MIINLILIILLVNTVIYKYNSPQLSCGLFGYCGLKKPDINLIKILGAYNVERGAESAGIMVGKEVVKDTGSFFKLMQDNEFPPLQKSNYTIIGHTRKSSSGVVSKENAHPFTFTFPTNADSPIGGVHNGTIFNIEELKTEFNVKTKSVVDSSILIQAILNNPNRLNKVLSFYRGNATVMISDTRTPNTLYIFKGASKNSSHAKVIYEERPLYMWNKGDTEKYFSSLKTSLKAIGAKEEEIEDLPCNQFMKFKNGKLEKSISINRENSFSFKEYVAPSYSTSYNNNYNYYDSVSSKKQRFREDWPTVDMLKKIGKRVYLSEFRYRYRDVHNDPSTEMLLHGSFRLFPDGSFDEGKVKGKTLYFSHQSNTYHFFRGILLNKPLTDEEDKFLKGFFDDSFSYILNQYSIKYTDDEKYDRTEYNFLRSITLIADQPFGLLASEIKGQDKKKFQDLYKPWEFNINQYSAFNQPKGSTVLEQLKNGSASFKKTQSLTTYYHSGTYKSLFSLKCDYKFVAGEIDLEKTSKKEVVKAKKHHNNTYNKCSTSFPMLLDNMKDLKKMSSELVQDIEEDIINSKATIFDVNTVKSILKAAPVAAILQGNHNTFFSRDVIKEVLSCNDFLGEMYNNIDEDRLELLYILDFCYNTNQFGKSTDIYSVIELSSKYFIDFGIPIISRIGIFSPGAFVEVSLKDRTYTAYVLEEEPNNNRGCVEVHVTELNSDYTFSVDRVRLLPKYSDVETVDISDVPDEDTEDGDDSDFVYDLTEDKEYVTFLDDLELSLDEIDYQIDGSISSLEDEEDTSHKTVSRHTKVEELRRINQTFKKVLTSIKQTIFVNESK